MKILNLGSLNLDRVYQVEHFVKGQETISAQSYSENAGGKGSVSYTHLDVYKRQDGNRGAAGGKT